MGFVNCELKDNIAIVTINRPEALNALNSQVLDDLAATFDAIDTNVVRAVVLTGAGGFAGVKAKKPDRADVRDPGRKEAEKLSGGFPREWFRRA